LFLVPRPFASCCFIERKPIHVTFFYFYGVFQFFSTVRCCALSYIITVRMVTWKQTFSEERSLRRRILDSSRILILASRCFCVTVRIIDWNIDLRRYVTMILLVQVLSFYILHILSFSCVYFVQLFYFPFSSIFLITSRNSILL